MPNDWNHGIDGYSDIRQIVSYFDEDPLCGGNFLSDDGAVVFEYISIWDENIAGRTSTFMVPGDGSTAP